MRALKLLALLSMLGSAVGLIAFILNVMNVGLTKTRFSSQNHKKLCRKNREAVRERLAKTQPVPHARFVSAVPFPAVSSRGPCSGTDPVLIFAWGDGMFIGDDANAGTC